MWRQIGYTLKRTRVYFSSVKVAAYPSTDNDGTQTSQENGSTNKVPRSSSNVPADGQITTLPRVTGHTDFDQN